MNNLTVKIWLPLLLLALVAAFYFELRSVKSIDLDVTYRAPAINTLQPTSQQPKPAVKSRLAIGERYDSLDALVADQQAAEYLKTGYFGKFWPATVTEVTTANDGIVFLKRDGTRHNYTGFDGYRMKMVRLSGGGEQETIVVFRSVEKR